MIFHIFLTLLVLCLNNCRTWMQKNQHLYQQSTPSATYKHNQQDMLCLNQSSTNFNNLRETYDILSNSKKLIEEISSRRFANYQNKRSNKELRSGKDGEQHRKKLTTKQKIEGSLKLIKQNETIAGQILKQQNSAKTKAQYINIVQQMYSSGSNKKKGKKIRHYQNEQAPRIVGRRDQVKHISNYQQAIRNVGVLGSQHYISDEPEQQFNQSSANQKRQLKKYREQELEQINNQLNQDNRLKQLKSQQKSKKNLSREDNTHRVSINIGIGQQNNPSQQLIDLSFSDSSQQMKGEEKAQRFDFFQALAKQIQQDIQGCRFRSNKKLSNRQQQLSSVDHHGQANQNRLRLDEQIKSIKNTFNTNLNSDQDLKSENSSFKDDENSNIHKTQKNQSGMYSFRPPHSNLNNEFAPKESPNYTFTHDKDDIGDQPGNKSSRYSDHGTGISQSRVCSLLEAIKRRVQLSPIVIQAVKYQHRREDNNQLQIDSRFQKQTRQRQDLIERIVYYCDEKDRFKRCPMKRTVKNFEDLILLDQSGKKSFVQSTTWRSPGKSISKEKFSSLRTPILNGQSCCQNGSNEILVDQHWQHLLQSRSADTLKNWRNSRKTLIQRTIAYKSKKTQANIEENYRKRQLEEQQEKNCIMKESRWQEILKLRNNSINYLYRSH